MKFISAPVQGAFIVQVEPVADDRGFFARSWCGQEFQAHGLNPRLLQCSISFNKRRGTLRGMHYQEQPFAEAKAVRCTAGCIYDVIVDIRRDSSTYRKWFGVELSASNRSTLYVPEGVAHGFQTLTDEAEVFYQISESHHPECARGVRWNDPLFRVEWPIGDPILSERDRTFPDYKP